MLKLGSQGPRVRSVQEMLKFLGFGAMDFSAGTPKRQDFACDGMFGAQTEAAVLEFQQAEQLYVDGVVGPSTLRVLEDVWRNRQAELSSPMAESVSEAPLAHSLVRVKADPYGNGHDGLYLRDDVAEAYGKVYDGVHAAGGLMTSSGGIRHLDVAATANRSAVSMHYVGRALDLNIYSGMVDPETDPYVASRVEARRYAIFARCAKANNPDAALPESRTIDNCVSYGDRTAGVTVTDRFLNLTDLFADQGFRPIRARPAFERGGDILAAEWWHFQYETGLVEGVTTFGDELLKIYAPEDLADTAPWREHDRAWQVRWF